MHRIPSPDEKTEVLPFLALNDIFIGESLSARFAQIPPERLSMRKDLLGGWSPFGLG